MSNTLEEIAARLAIDTLYTNMMMYGPKTGTACRCKKISDDRIESVKAYFSQFGIKVECRLVEDDLLFYYIPPVIESH